MRMIAKLLFVAAALCIVLMLGAQSEETPTALSSNPMKVNQQQYERIHSDQLYVKGQ